MLNLLNYSVNDFSAGRYRLRSRKQLIQTLMFIKLNPARFTIAKMSLYSTAFVLIELIRKIRRDILCNVRLRIHTSFPQYINPPFIRRLQSCDPVSEMQSNVRPTHSALYEFELLLLLLIIPALLQFPRMAFVETG